LIEECYSHCVGNNHYCATIIFAPYGTVRIGKKRSKTNTLDIKKIGIDSENASLYSDDTHGERAHIQLQENTQQ